MTYVSKLLSREKRIPSKKKGNLARNYTRTNLDVLSCPNINLVHLSYRWKGHIKKISCKKRGEILEWNTQKSLLRSTQKVANERTTCFLNVSGNNSSPLMTLHTLRLLFKFIR
jgi:hypothetical protein